MFNYPTEPELKISKYFKVYYFLAEEAKDVTDAGLAVGSSLKNVRDALDDLSGGTEVLAVVPSLCKS